MNKRLIIILALAFAVGIAFAAYAEVQNVKVSGDLTVQGVSRQNLILRGGDSNPLGATSPSNTGGPFNQYDRSVSGIISHIRVRIDADLTDNVSTTVRLINERVWGEETAGTSNSNANNYNNASSSNVGIDLAYATMKEFLYSPLTLTVGRQELHFGNDLIIGDPDTNNLMAGHSTTPAAADVGRFLPKSLDDLTQRKAFDAVRATLNYDPLVVDAVYAKINSGAIDMNDDVDLYGVNANYALSKNTTVETYYWEKRRIKAGASDSQNTLGGAAQLSYGGHAHDDATRTIGARGEYKGIKNLTVGLEGAWQFGTHVNNTTLYPDDVLNNGAARTRKAYAIQLVSQYNLSDLIKKYEPTLGFSFTHLSGDPYRSREHTYRGWDPMFENQAGGTLFNKIVGYSNAQLYNAKVSTKPMQDVTFSLDYYYLRLLKAYRSDDTMLPNAVNLTGVIGDPTYSMKPGKYSLGNEVDVKLTYDYTEDVQLGLGGGWFIPGEAFNKINRKTATQVIGSMKVTF